MHDETEAKAMYAQAEDARTPLKRSMAGLGEAIQIANAMSEKLASALGPVLRDVPPSPKRDDVTQLEPVSDASFHVRELQKAQDGVEVVCDRLRSLLERIEV